MAQAACWPPPARRPGGLRDDGAAIAGKGAARGEDRTVSAEVIVRGDGGRGRGRGRGRGGGWGEWGKGWGRSEGELGGRPCSACAV